MDEDLRHLIDAWPTLPEPIGRGIVAMVQAAGKGPTKAHAAGREGDRAARHGDEPIGPG